MRLVLALAGLGIALLGARAAFAVSAASGEGVEVGGEWQPDTMSGPAESFGEAITTTLGLALPASADEVRAVSAEANVQAFLRAIRLGEGTSGPDGYRTLFGGGKFDSFADHPRIKVTAKLGGRSITSTAAGAYQALAGTWDDFVRAVGPRDFSPASQDEFAIWAISRRRALDDVRAGRIEAAIAKCAKEWASLPGSPYGQPVVSLAAVKSVYEQNGGSYA